MKPLNKPLHLLVLALVALLSVRCASDFTSNFESAKFALDQGDYTSAITLATAALQAKPGDIETTRLLANAYLGRSDIEFLELAEGMTTLEDSTDPNFSVIAGFLPTTATLSDLRAAITTLEALSGIDASSFTNEGLADAAFDLATMQMVESFALGVYGANYFTTLDVTGITDTQRQSVQSDLVNFDNRMIASGVASDQQFIQEVRQTFCILEPISAGSGFTLTEYQALVGCQLSADATTFNTVAIDAGIATCAALAPDSQSADVQACYTSDTAL